MRTESKPRIILDTNIIISGILFKGKAIRSLLLLALNEYQLVFSQTTWDELATVMQRDGFEKNMPLGARLRVLAELASNVELVHSTSCVTDCRDPKDNKFLYLALDAKVTTIITGDSDLLVLHPYKGIAIYSPADFMRVH
ncbi:MAG: putative toxin-antitoxin system toxin component PIN family [Comamonadaceae bacterium]|nr:MAG: putative toxin-antitoxin system toxin component PIN family [Comamonadaceae bacterium]